MKFSNEEIYLHFGQYDRFVVLEFEPESEAYKIRPSIMGTFVYSFDDRSRLQGIIDKPIDTRTDTRVRFEPSSSEKLDKEIVTLLDKEGIQCSSIRSITYYDGPIKNDFVQKGEKELKKMIIPFRTRGIDPFILRLGLLRTRIRTGYGLIPEEKYEYEALEIYFGATSEAQANEKSHVHISIRYYYLNIRYYKGNLTAEEEIEFFDLLKARTEEKTSILFKEIEVAGISLSSLVRENKSVYSALLATLIKFDSELLLPYEIPIWWDYERFLHVYIRHVKEMQAGGYTKEKTIFQYGLEDITIVVENVIKQIYPEILEHFKERPDKPFFRIGKRMPYYNGNYYRVDIEPGGRLVAFHPYNDNEDKVISI